MNNYNEHIIIVLVGLPARGVSTLGKKIARYFAWLGYSTSIFNKDLYEISLSLDIVVSPAQDLDQFDHKMIEKASFFLNNGGNIAIIDANNYTSLQRKSTSQRLEGLLSKPSKILYLEVINNDKESVNEIIKYYCSYSDHYKNVPTDEAISSYKLKIEALEAVYEQLDLKCDGEDCSYIRVYRHSTKFEAQNVRTGYLTSKLMAFIMNVKLDKKKTVYLLKHAESYNSIQGIYGSDLGITENGIEYSRKLKQYFLKEKGIVGDVKEFILYISSLKRTEETSQHLIEIGNITSLKCLDDINVGAVDGKNINEIKESYERELNQRTKDKLNFRFERGESYMDLINRLDNFIFDLERTSSAIIVIGHQSVLRCLYGYLKSVNVEQIPYLPIQENCIIKIEEFVNTRIEETIIAVDREECFKDS